MKGRVLNSINALEQHRVGDLFLVAHDELVEALEKSLHEGIVKFEYLKVSDGSVRQAFGTLKADFMPNSADKVMKEAFKQIEPAYGSYIEQGGTKDLVDVVVIAMGKAEEIFEKERTKERKVKTPDTIVYYDLEAQGFRSMKKDSFISVYA